MAELQIIVNDQHKTRATVREGTLSHTTIDRVRNALCKDKSCECQRALLCQSGPQWCHIYQQPDGLVFVTPLPQTCLPRPGDEPPPST